MSDEPDRDGGDDEAETEREIAREVDRLVPRRLITGVVWYTPVEWARVKAISADASSFEDTYEDWVAVVADGIARIPSQHEGEMRPVNLTADGLLEWSRQTGRVLDSQARVEYMMLLLRQQQDAVREATRRMLRERRSR